MDKIGILTFHYSNNYGGVLQALALQNTIMKLGYDVEIINYIPSSYKPNRKLSNLGISKRVFNNKLINLNVFSICKKLRVMKKYSSTISLKFDNFRKNEMHLSKKVDESTLKTILNEYSFIIVGSDQIWNPSQRKNPVYFLNFGEDFQGNKISYAADSTIKHVSNDDLIVLKSALNTFTNISVRNEHTLHFVKTLINKDVDIVCDPTLLYDFTVEDNIASMDNEYILMYVLGEEITGSHKNALKKIKKKIGDLPVHSIKIPTMKFDLSPYAEKTYYDLDPNEWLKLIKNAKFIYTDSFHGVLFAIKYQKPFLAYYNEELRSTRFIDLGKRYNIDKYIVQNVDEISTKSSLDITPDFKNLNSIISQQKKDSIEFLKEALESKGLTVK